MDQEIHKLNKLVSLMPYLTDINKTNYVNVGSNNSYTSVGEVNILSLIKEYFVKLTRKIISEKLAKNDSNIADKYMRKDDRSYINIHMAKIELKKLERLTDKRKRELRKINGQIKSARMYQIALLRQISLYQRELDLIKGAKGPIEIIKL